MSQRVTEGKDEEGEDEKLWKILSRNYEEIRF